MEVVVVPEKARLHSRPKWRLQQKFEEGGGVVVGLVVSAGTGVAVGLGVVVVVAVVVVVVAADADSITPQATRLPESPVDRVSSSGPGAPLFCW